MTERTIASHATPGIRRPRTVKLLIVDKDDGFRAVVKSGLASQRWVDVVAEARDGAEAVGLARGLQFNVVIMDLDAPGMDGLETTRRIKAEQPGAKIIMLAVDDEEARRAAGGATGVDGVVLKRAITAELVPAIQSVSEVTARSEPSEPNRWRVGRSR